METPSQRIWAQWHDVMAAPGLEAHLPPTSARPVTLVETAQRMIAGDPLRVASADFVDDVRWARDAADVHRRVDDEPPPVDGRRDAYLAALAEHVCSARATSAPAWCLEPTRFLDRWWFPSNTPALDARAVVESPAAFRRRGIFVGAGAVRRV